MDHEEATPLDQSQQQSHQEEEQVTLGCKEEQVTLGCKEEQPNNNNNIIMKGKRTKRMRTQSPIPFAIPTMNSSTAEGGGGPTGVGKCNINTANSSTSPMTSSAEEDNTEEEEDMANCLILLAQGHSLTPPKIIELHQPHDHHHKVASTATTSSRSFMEAMPLFAAVGQSKVVGAGGGFYVYECKTCSRTFPSFQALGGHRASHKKPKAAAAMNLEKHQFGIGMMLPSDEEDDQFFKNNKDANNNSPLSLHLSNRGLVLSSSNNTNNINKSKVHECAICGAEFNSGQALGGHMRRHRGPVAANMTLALTATPVATTTVVPFALRATQPQHQHQQYQQQPLKKQRSMLCLDLDLNLPAAPELDEHHHRDRDQSNYVKQQQQQQQQQPQQPQQQQQQQERLRILVDCHY